MMLLICLLLLQLFQGCGWRLRGALGIELQLPPLMLDVQKGGAELRNILQKGLESSGVTIAAQASEAELVLTIHDEIMERRVLTVDSSGKVNEYELQYSLVYSVRDRDGEFLIPKRTLKQRRDYQFDEAQVLAKDKEQTQLFEFMRRNSAQSVLRSLRGLASAQSEAEAETETELSSESSEQQPDTAEPVNAD